MEVSFKIIHLEAIKENNWPVIFKGLFGSSEGTRFYRRSGLHSTEFENSLFRNLENYL